MYMSINACKGCQMRQSNGVLFKEVAGLQRSRLIEVTLCTHYNTVEPVYCGHHWDEIFWLL